MLKKDVAVQLMKHLVDHDWHGYSQVSRWGDGEGVCNVAADGKNYELEQGDRDCSSAIISAYEVAGISCGGATYTGNMRALMTGTGNFRWHPIDGYVAKSGDVYLNESDHTAMCLSDVPDLLMEFSISETGGINGAEGDQTGWESHTRAYYNYPWDGILECVNNESADGLFENKNTEISSNSATLSLPKYRVYTYEDGWLEYMLGLVCEDGCGDDYAGVPGHLIRDIQIENLGKNGWFQLTMKQQGELPRNQQNTNLSDYVIGITVYFDTPAPEQTGYYKAKYRISPAGKDYLKWEYDNEDGGAGDDVNGIDRFQLTIEK